MRLILASASPRRAALLTAAGYAFDVHPVDIDETVRSGETAAAYVERLAREKSARALFELMMSPAEAGQSAPEDLAIIAADTAVVLGDEILGKPHGADEAARMLRRLSGRTHQVMTGLSVRSSTADVAHVEISSVTFGFLTERQITWYVASGEGADKAGGYAIQGLASRFVPRIEGSHANVVGLPVAALDSLIERLGPPKRLLASPE
jgi:septum formation protein